MPLNSTFVRYASTLLLHALIWGLIGLLLASPPPGQPSPLPTAFWLKQGAVLLALMVLFYANALWAVPRLLYRRRVWLYLPLLAAAVAGVLGLHQRLEVALNVPELLAQARENALNVSAWCGPRPHVQLGPQDEPEILNPGILLITLLTLAISTGTTVVQRAQHEAQVRRELEQEKLATELSLLKAQINPHFFFNTLNNIYALTLIDGEQARAALHRLSRMMRYVLYETPAGTTLLSHELTFARDYIELMHLRLTDKVQVTFDAPEHVREVQIAPMMLLPFVENAFKHGVSAVEPSRIYIGVRQPDAHTVEMEVRNTLFPERAGSLDEPGGIGLVNTRRRLELLYPGRYTLTVNPRTAHHEYQVLLTLAV
ncbi:sensor histidine kinase [Hymenobacter jeollabukensis]|uniref:Sensor histidine kinase n=1 Tax=Hymenobacter jeollabukensis TaxID=2025313 RepID=A0A5R8WXS0_9BACT|nr:histidine kinase [Hymenobacter jeollabukensis]TLM96945.1 sensor histidine kinase [Hymenobacter jeollabukensis]